MNIIAVDDEKFALNSLQTAIKEAMPDSTLSCFNKSKTALEYTKHNNVDVAFLDIEMGGMNGLELAKHMKVINGKTIIIFVTGYSQYAVEAFALRANGYLMKPVTANAVLKEVEHLCIIQHNTNGYKLPEATTNSHSDTSSNHNYGKKIRVQTFGNFEVFADEKPLIFSRSKTKELFAYLVSRKGALCNNNEIAAVIWEDKDDSSSLQSMFRTLVADLIQTLNEAGIDNVFIKKRGYIGIIPKNISCDLYDFFEGIKINNYIGEFMNQYSWAEFTNSYLDRIQTESHKNSEK
jgi:two-component SAPR family response regulator